MKFTMHALAFAVMGGALALAQQPASFGSPTRIKAGDAYLGEGRLYPSPVVRDMNEDKVPDVVIGDLLGKVTVATRHATDDGAATLGPEMPLQNREGKPLRFHNW